MIRYPLAVKIRFCVSFIKLVSFPFTVIVFCLFFPDPFLGLIKNYKKSFFFVDAQLLIRF